MLNRLKKSLGDQVKRFKNRSMMEATVAICARVALADGVISPEEKQKMIGFLNQSPELQVFDTKEVVAFFEKMTSMYDFDAEVGKGETMKAILAIKSQPDMAQLAVRVGIAVGKSDGSFDNDEKRELNDIINALGLTPSGFDL